MNQPPIDENSENSTPSGKTPFERSRFGGTVRTPKVEDEVPVSKSDLSRGAEELSQNKTTQVNWSVLIISSLVITAFSVWAIVTPGRLGRLRSDGPHQTAGH